MSTLLDPFCMFPHVLLSTTVGTDSYSVKATLFRIVDEEGITLTEITNVALKSLPDTFKEWRNTFHRVQSEQIFAVSFAAE
tara:strand:- start:6 stop:248 length:243 start_codon:yes stop_codon:yes gene_type:complete